MKKLTILSIVALAVLCSCRDGGLRVSGIVSGGGDSTSLLLEYTSNGVWFIADSARTSGNGEFSFNTEAPEHPNIYRVRLGSDAIYFPVDSADNISIKANAKHFATGYTLAGTPHAVQVMNIDRKAQQFSDKAPSEEALKQWKHELAEQLLKEPGSIVAFYIINKNINGKPLFDPADFDDLKIIGAVANAYSADKPDDPRTKLLVETFLAGQKRKREAKGIVGGKRIEASEATLLDIKLQDYNGKEQSLERTAASNPVVVLVFSMLHDNYAPELHRVLRSLQSKGKCIYQVGLDENEAVWRQTAHDLPWIVVRDPMGTQSRHITAYNLQALPTAYIVRNGEIVERVDDVTTLESVAAKY